VQYQYVRLSAEPIIKVTFLLPSAETVTARQAGDAKLELQDRQTKPDDNDSRCRSANSVTARVQPTTNCLESVVLRQSTTSVARQQQRPH